MTFDSNSTLTNATMTKTTYNSASSSTWFLPTNYKNMANISFTPTHDMHPATKKYVDDLVAAGATSNIEVINITDSAMQVDPENYYLFSIDQTKIDEILQKHSEGKDLILEYYFMNYLPFHFLFLANQSEQEEVFGTAYPGYNIDSASSITATVSNISIVYANLQILKSADPLYTGGLTIKVSESAILPEYTTLVLTGKSVEPEGELELGSVFYTAAEGDIMVFLNGEKLICSNALNADQDLYHYSLVQAGYDASAIDRIRISQGWSIVPEDVIEIMVRVNPKYR